jgi:hypothetical protein
MKVSSILDDALILCAMSIKSQYSGLMVICFGFLLFYGLAFRVLIVWTISKMRN